MISVSVHRFSLLVPIQRQNECHTRWFKLIQSVSAWKGVTRSRRSSAWPIPFCGQLLTSQSGTVTGPGGESSPRGTEAVCLCSGRAGRSHTVGRKEEGQKKRRWRRKGKIGKRRDKLTNYILYFATYMHFFLHISSQTCFILYWVEKIFPNHADTKALLHLSKGIEFLVGAKVSHFLVKPKWLFKKTKQPESSTTCSLF